MTLYAWFISLSMYSRFIHAAAALIPFYGSIIFHCMNIPHLFIYSSIGGHLGCFQLLAILNGVAMNICVEVFEYLFSIPVGIYLGGEVLGPVVIPAVNLLRNCQAVFYGTHLFPCGYIIHLLSFNIFLNRTQTK